MQDLFERETHVLKRAKHFLNSLSDSKSNYYEELVSMIMEYECLLRQARLMVRCSDLNAIGLNADKMDLLDKVNIDQLTSIYNRRFLEENLTRYLQLLSRTNGYIALFMLDIDFFKKYNDTYGHAAGDLCLKKVARTLQESLSKAEDFVARYGGEEFVVVLSGAKKEEAIQTGKYILKRVRELQIPHINNEVADCVTISIGITSALALQEHKPQQYIERADAALYKSKTTGRNKITYYEFEEEL